MTKFSTNNLATDAAGGLRDIVGPIRIVTLAERLLFWGSLLAALLLAAALLWWWHRRRRARNAQPPGPPPLPPHERARRRLEAALHLLSEPERFCTEVSAALRVYLEERFGWNAPDRTTEEFLAELRRLPEEWTVPHPARRGSPGSVLASTPASPSALSHAERENIAARAALQEPLGDFLTRCDFVKFARYDPTEQELLELQRAALRIVDDTVPPPVPVEPPPGSVAAPTDTETA